MQIRYRVTVTFEVTANMNILDVRDTVRDRMDKVCFPEDISRLDVFRVEYD